MLISQLQQPPKQSFTLPNRGVFDGIDLADAWSTTFCYAWRSSTAVEAARDDGDDDENEAGAGDEEERRMPPGIHRLPVVCTTFSLRYCLDARHSAPEEVNGGDGKKD